MDKIRLGILGTADVAYRRFLPALMENPNFEYVGVASRNYSNTVSFCETYGGLGFSGYESLINSGMIDAVYIPLPPALHYKWAKKSLEKGIHVMVEKPFTTHLSDTCSLLNLARNNSLAIHENYMFVYHSQLDTIRKLLNDDNIGELRLIRSSFGFPFRGSSDFRYNKSLGGGALLDCGYYPIKIGSLFLGKTTHVNMARLYHSSEFNVDIYGSATLENENGMIAQISFGIDNSYKCELELWGSKGNIRATRIFTAPANFNPEIIVSVGDTESIVMGGINNQFLKSIEIFHRKIDDISLSIMDYADITLQSKLMEDFQKQIITG